MITCIVHATTLLAQHYSNGYHGWDSRYTSPLAFGLGISIEHEASNGLPTIGYPLSLTACCIGIWLAVGAEAV